MGIFGLVCIHLCVFVFWFLFRKIAWFFVAGLKSFLNLLPDIEVFLDNNISEAALIAIPAISVAIILPIVVFLADKNNSEYPFDKNVIFKKILDYKILMGIILVTSIVLLLDIKILSLICTGVILVETAVVLFRAYKWFCSYEEIKYKMTYRQSMRIQFLESLNDVDEILETWNLILSDEDLYSKNQVGLVATFIKTSEILPDTVDNWSKSTYLRFFSQNIEKINFNDVKVFEKTVQFAGDYYRQEQQRNNSKDTFPPYELKNIFLKLLHIAIDRDDHSRVMDYVFFNEVEKMSKGLGVDRDEFNESFLLDFLHELERSDANIFRIWQGKYLGSLIVTRERLENEETRKSAASIFQAYNTYMSNYVISYDDLEPRTVQVLEKSTEYILKDVDPYFWFDMMTFCCRSFADYQGKNIYYSMVRSWCENDRNYGLSGRMKSFSTKDFEKEFKESTEREYAETAYLAGAIHPWLRNPDECKKILKEIKNIKSERIFEKDSVKNGQLERLEGRFKYMLDFIKIEKKEGQKIA